MNAWKQKKTFADVTKDIAGCMLIAAMWVGLLFSFVIF